MTYILIHHDESGQGWRLYSDDGTEVAGPWQSDPRRADHTEMAEAMSTTALVTDDHYFIRESSDTPIPF